MIKPNDVFKEIEKQRLSGELRELVRSKNGPIYGANKRYPGKIMRSNLDGSKQVGLFENNKFIVEKDITGSDLQ